MVERIREVAPHKLVVPAYRVRLDTGEDDERLRADQKLRQGTAVLGEVARMAVGSDQVR